MSEYVSQTVSECGKGWPRDSTHLNTGEIGLLNRGVKRGDLSGATPYFEVPQSF